MRIERQEVYSEQRIWELREDIIAVEDGVPEKELIVVHVKDSVLTGPRGAVHEAFRQETPYSEFMEEYVNE